MANTDSISNNVDINSLSDEASVKHFSANWPMSVTPGTAQFAILYNESMCVYEGIPAEKMNEIMLMAGANAKSTEMKSGICFTSLFSTTNNPPASPQDLPSPQSVCFPPAADQKTSICRMQEFPIARRQSLQSFFEKRRMRVRSKGPYTSSTSKEANNIENNFNPTLVPLEGK